MCICTEFTQNMECGSFLCALQLGFHMVQMTIGATKVDLSGSVVVWSSKRKDTSTQSCQANTTALIDFFLKNFLQKIPRTGTHGWSQKLFSKFDLASVWEKH